MPLQSLYALAGYLILPLVLGRLALRGLRSPAYLCRWGERLGWAPFPPLNGAIWIHAVSVGEVGAAAPLVEGLRERHPHRPLVVTTTTPTGSERVRTRFGESVYHSYLPYDLPGPLARFLRRADPALVVIMETELWPRLFLACARRGIPLLVVNARLSSASLRRYRRIRSLIRPALANARVLAQTEADAEGFRELGAPVDRLSVVGNLKYEHALPLDTAQKAEELRRAIDTNRPIWIAGSTHEGEENAVLAAHEGVRHCHPGALLILVPRHPERFEEVALLCARRGLATPRRSRGEKPGPQDEVYLVDTMGELTEFYGAADVAFVGGSLVPVGGHNLLEPAAQGIPTLAGPHLTHFQAISERLAEAGALWIVRSALALGDAVAELLQDPQRRFAMGQAGQDVVAQNRGAKAKVLEAIEMGLSPSKKDASKVSRIGPMPGE